MKNLDLNRAVTGRDRKSPVIFSSIKDKARSLVFRYFVSCRARSSHDGRRNALKIRDLVIIDSRLTHVSRFQCSLFQFFALLTRLIVQPRLRLRMLLRAAAESPLD
jgi:hypothetical protein